MAEQPDKHPTRKTVYLLHHVVIRQVKETTKVQIAIGCFGSSTRPYLE